MMLGEEWRVLVEQRQVACVVADLETVGFMVPQLLGAGRERVSQGDRRTLGLRLDPPGNAIPGVAKLVPAGNGFVAHRDGCVPEFIDAGDAFGQQAAQLRPGAAPEQIGGERGLPRRIVDRGQVLYNRVHDLASAAQLSRLDFGRNSKFLKRLRRWPGAVNDEIAKTLVERLQRGVHPRRGAARLTGRVAPFLQLLGAYARRFGSGLDRGSGIQRTLHKPRDSADREANTERRQPAPQRPDCTRDASERLVH